jgi:hypothetical protein
MLLTQKSLSQTEKVARVLSKCSDEDLTDCINGNITSSMLYNKCTKRDYNTEETPTTDISVLKERAKRLKDDSEAEITGDMIIGMVYRTAVDYADNIPMYLDMLKQNECVDKIQVLKTITNIENIFNGIVSSLRDAI